MRWLRNHFPGGTSSWSERLLGLSFLGSALGLWFGAGGLSAAQQAVLWAVWFAALALTVRLGWLPLFGPVLGADFVRTARRGRYVVLRMVYAVGLFLFLLAMHRNQGEFSTSWMGGAGGMARFAENFTYTYLVVQLVAVAVLTPAYTAGAIAEEKDRQTLEFLLATELRNRELILGKLVSRLGNLTLLMLTGLPILSLTMLWGGVDYGVLLSAFAITGLLMLSLGGVSLLASVHSRRARDAIVLTYLTAAGYLGLTALAELLLAVPGVGAYVVHDGPGPLMVSDVLQKFNAGNPALLGYYLHQDLRMGTTLQTALPARLRDFTAFHLLVTAVSLAWAVARVRALALAEKHEAPTPRKNKAASRWRPSMRQPFLWKEVWAEPGLTFNWFGKTILALIVLCSVAPALWIGGDFVWEVMKESSGSSEFVASYAVQLKFFEAINLWVRIVGTLVACLTLLGVAVRAASSVSGEHDRQTFDSLMTAPVESGTVLFAKWLGSLASVRWAWIWLCLVWVLGIATGGLFPGTVPWMLLAWVVYAAFLASLGLWFSTSGRTTLQATMATLVTSAVVGVGHWYVYLIFCLPLNLRSDAARAWVRFQLFGLTPPYALGWLAFRGDDVGTPDIGDHEGNPLQALACLIGGLLFWLTFAVVLYRWAGARFRRMAMRGPLRQAEPVTPDVRPTPVLSWRLRAALAIAVVLLVGGIGGFIGLSVRAERDVKVALIETDALDPTWRLERIEADREAIPINENGGLVVLEARKLMPRWGWPTQERTDEGPGLLSAERRPTTEQFRWIIDQQEGVEEALIAIRPLVGLSRGRYPLSLDANYIMTLMPHLDARHSVRNLLWHDLVLRAEEGDPDGAAMVCLQLLNLARTLGDEPLFVSQMVRNIQAREAVQGAQRVLAQGEPSDERLRVLQEACDAEARHNGLVIGGRGERAGMDAFMTKIESGEISWTKTFDAMLDQREERGKFEGEKIMESVTPGSEQAARAAYLRYMNRFIEAAALSPEEQGAAFAVLTRERTDLPAFARRLALDPTRVGDNFRGGRAELRCAAAALAAERFRRREGRWPESLDELVPRDLSAVPLDPFTGQAVLFKRLDDGLVSYSVGPDGQDDGGAVTLSLDGPKGKDFGFRLWDVSHRRQPAGPGR